MTEQEALDKLKDPFWRINHLYKIKTKDQRLITFKQNLAQSAYYSSKTNRDIILKARQLGFTTEKLIEQLDYTIFNKNTNSAIIAHQRDKVTILFEIVRLAYDHLHPSIKPLASYENRNELYFPELGSKIFVALDTRGETIHNLHVSELAFIEHAEERMLGILESVPKGCPISFESTANGMAGYFYETYVDDRNEFKKHFYNWAWDSGYSEPAIDSLDVLHRTYSELAIQYGLIPDIYDRFALSLEQYTWYVNKVIRLRQAVVQEYPTTAIEAFIASGRNVFSVMDLNKHVTSPALDRKWHDLFIWEKPLEGFKYVIGCDPSEGIGGDNAVIEVFNAYTGEQAAEFASNRVPPDILAGYLMEIGKYYNNALIVLEVNGTMGGAVLTNLRGKYANMYQRETFDKHSREISHSLGWKTTGVTKPILVSDLEARIREQSVHINSHECIREMRTFVQTDEPNKQGFGAEGTAKDDRVMACGLAVQGFKMIPKQATPKSLAQQKLEEYVKRHQIPDVFMNEKPQIHHYQKRNYKIRIKGRE